MAVNRQHHEIFSPVQKMFVAKVIQYVMRDD